jgi:hypothetical protein
MREQIVKDRDADHVVDPSAEQDVCGENFLNEFCEEHEAAPDFVPLDHPHTEPRCEFCAVRQQQRPSQHRLWCSVFLVRVCNCGYEQAS